MAIGLCSLVLLGAACSGARFQGVRPLGLREPNHTLDPAASDGAPPVDPTAQSPEALGGAATSAEILSAWRAAEQAFLTAAETGDASEPALPATTIDPQLTFTEELLRGMDAAGELARGPVDLGRPVVVADTPDEATVRSCLHDAEIVLFRQTERPVPGIEGQVADELVVSLMVKTDGAWRLSDQTVRAGACV